MQGRLDFTSLATISLMALSQPIDLRALLGDVVIDGRFTSVPLENLEDCVIGLYFSAHWCLYTVSSLFCYPSLALGTVP